MIIDLIDKDTIIRTSRITEHRDTYGACSRQGRCEQLYMEYGPTPGTLTTGRTVHLLMPHPPK